jgi:hypothetical protein
VPRTRRLPTPLSSPPLRINQRTQIIEPIGGHQPRGDQLPESSLNLGFEFSRPAHNVRKERSPTLPQKLEDQTRSMTQPAARVPHFSLLLGEVGIFTPTLKTKPPIH